MIPQESLILGIGPVEVVTLPVWCKQGLQLFFLLHPSSAEILAVAASARGAEAEGEAEISATCSTCYEPPDGLDGILGRKGFFVLHAAEYVFQCFDVGFLRCV